VLLRNRGLPGLQPASFHQSIERQAARRTAIAAIIRTGRFHMPSQAAGAFAGPRFGVIGCKPLPEFPGRQEAGADELAPAPDQPTYPKHSAVRRERWDRKSRLVQFDPNVPSRAEVFAMSPHRFPRTGPGGDRQAALIKKC
jgi:hypothetical protein